MNYSKPFNQEIKTHHVNEVMKKILIGISILVFSSCGDSIKKTESAQLNEDATFNAFKERFVLRLWEIYPGWASSQGYHKFDSVLIIPDDAQRKKELAFCDDNLDSLKTFHSRNLSDNNKIDLKIIEGQLNSTKWYIKNYKSYEWNPSDYNVCGGFAEMLANDYDSLNNRLRNFYSKMRNVKAYYETAKRQLKYPTVEHTRLAITQNLGGASTFDADLKAALDKSSLNVNEKDLILQRAAEVKVIIGDYARFLKEFKNDNPRPFQLGKELYSEKFSHDIQSEYTADEIFQKVQAHKEELHVKMFALTKKLWPKYLEGKNIPSDSLAAIRQLIDVISLRHVAPDSFQLEIERQIPLLVNFVTQKDLIFLDPAKPLVVRKEPAYMAGVAGASISSPGPYDKEGNTYYNVGSFSGWSKEQIESYLREYNYYILQILNIHEAIPGHYTQLIYSNKSPSIIKAIFGNGAMVEGWAVYSELMMLENGFGNNSDEMWLMYYKWNLRSTCNTILDYSVHVNNMTKEDAMNLLIKQAFQQQAEAEGKWKRVCVSQVQLCSYFTGFTEICALRDDFRKKQGAKYNLKHFHETFLSYGSAPVKYIKELMLNSANR
jgi:uncharacterized protein (DUF885 family)